MDLYFVKRSMHPQQTGPGHKVLFLRKYSYILDILNILNVLITLNTFYVLDVLNRLNILNILDVFGTFHIFNTLNTLNIFKTSNKFNIFIIFNIYESESLPGEPGMISERIEQSKRAGSQIKNKLGQVEKGRFCRGAELRSSAEKGAGDARRRHQLAQNRAPFPWKNLPKSGNSAPPDTP